jgi:myosin heavy subunit
LCSLRSQVRGQEKTLAALNEVAASDSRHALCKFVYGRMFDWLVERVNRAMENNAGAKLIKDSK